MNTNWLRSRSRYSPTPQTQLRDLSPERRQSRENAYRALGSSSAERALEIKLGVSGESEFPARTGTRGGAPRARAPAPVLCPGGRRTRRTGRATAATRTCRGCDAGLVADGVGRGEGRHGGRRVSGLSCARSLLVLACASGIFGTAQPAGRANSGAPSFTAGLQRSATAEPPNAHRQVFRVNGRGNCLDLSRTSPLNASSGTPRVPVPGPFRSIPKEAERPTETAEGSPPDLSRRPLRRPKARQVLLRL